MYIHTPHPENRYKSIYVVITVSTRLPKIFEGRTTIHVHSSHDPCILSAFILVGRPFPFDLEAMHRNEGDMPARVGEITVRRSGRSNKEHFP